MYLQVTLSGFCVASFSRSFWYSTK